MRGSAPGVRGSAPGGKPRHVFLLGLGWVGEGMVGFRGSGYLRGITGCQAGYTGSLAFFGGRSVGLVLLGGRSGLKFAVRGSFSEGRDHRVMDFALHSETRDRWFSIRPLAALL